MSWTAISWKVCFAGTITQSSPSVTSFGGKTLVAVGDEQGYVHLIDAATGAELPNWPERMESPPGGNAPIESSPTFAYLHGAHQPPDVVVAAGSTWVTSSVGEVETFTLTGHLLWRFQAGSAAHTARGVISTPAIGDILGNGQQQIVFGSWDHHVYVLDASGHQLGFAYDNADTIWSSPALYRLPGRHADDIYIGSDASGRTDGGTVGGRCVGGYVTDFRWSASAVDPDSRRVGPGLERSWYHCLNQSVWSSPAVGMIGGEATVVVGTGFYEQPFTSDTSRLFAFSALTGALRPGWPVRTAGPAVGSPSIGVINSSGVESVVETSWLCTGNTQPSCLASNHSVVQAFSAGGRRLWGTRLLGPTIEGSPTLVPLQGQLSNDVLVATSYGLYPLDGVTGRYLYGTNPHNQWAALNPACRSFSSVAVAPTGTLAAPAWEAVESCGGPPQFHFPGELAAMPLPVVPLGVPAWPMFRGESAHAGVLSTIF